MSLTAKLAAVAVTFVACSAIAAPVTTTYFGKLDGATFGGHGISNERVAVTQRGNLTLGLTVTGRNGGSLVTDNGKGVFSVEAGAYGSGDNLALWNYDFYIANSGLSSIGNYYKLLVDFNPATGNAVSTYTDMSVMLLGGPQNSENLGFLTNYSQFDPTQTGEYGFVLEAFNIFGQEIARTSILVDVEQKVPEPASLALVTVALAGLGFAARRRIG